MSAVPMVAVEVTAPAYLCLKHPSGESLNEAGEGSWPDDSFTARRILDGALRLAVTAPPEPAPAPAETPAGE